MLDVAPHVEERNAKTKTGHHCQNAIDASATRQNSYGMLQIWYKIFECPFGWGDRHGTMCTARHRGLACVLLQTANTIFCFRGRHLLKEKTYTLEPIRPLAQILE